MINIKINDDYYVTADDNQFILMKYTGHIDKRTGKPNDKPVGYFSSTEGALKRWAHLHLVDKEIATLHELSRAVSSIKDHISSLMSFEAVWVQKNPQGTGETL